MTDLRSSFRKEKEEKEGKDAGKGIVNYEQAGTVRNLCFVLQDGRETFLNYAYLISCEYEPEASKITLLYTTHEVVIKGSQLSVLNEGLKSQVPKEIHCSDARFEALKKEGEAFVTEIEIKKLQ